MRTLGEMRFAHRAASNVARPRPATGSSARPRPNLCASRRTGWCRARGLSMVELLVGVAIGLLIAASGITFLTRTMQEDRSLLVESRLMQDLRTAADVITRDLRRAGYWGAAEKGVWAAGDAAVMSNPYTAVSASASAPGAVSFGFSRDVLENDLVDSNERFGFRLRNGVLEMQLGASGWQALTDNGSVFITRFDVSPLEQQVSLRDSCTRTCPLNSATCPPVLTIRSFTLEISGRAAADANVDRTVRSAVRVRNDSVTGACAV
jgi:prepilin peptidase dependent protein B